MRSKESNALSRTIIGIDPDTDRSGVAVLTIIPSQDATRIHTAKRDVRVASLSFPELIEYLYKLKGEQDNDNNQPTQPQQRLYIIVEASWLLKTNWHLSRGEHSQLSASKGYDVGRNHEVGNKIVEMCQYLGLNVAEQMPLRKMWQGAGGKITHQELTEFVTLTDLTTDKPRKRTNQEERDATLIAYRHAGLPVRIRTARTR